MKNDDKPETYRKRRQSLRRGNNRWPPRNRHPFDRRSRDEQIYVEFIQRVSDARFWARHPAPFNKTEAGRLRREERLEARRLREDVFTPAADDFEDLGHYPWEPGYYTLREEKASRAVLTHHAEPAILRKMLERIYG